MGTSRRKPSGVGVGEWAFAGLLALQYVSGLQWAPLLNFSRALEDVCRNRHPSKLFCVHELHPLSRGIWAVARRAGVRGVTFQHSALVRDVLWYFPTDEERRAGLPLPHEITLYSESTRALLAPGLGPDIEVSMACGPRYARWRDVTPTRAARNGVPRLLFATSLPHWDNSGVLGGLKRLLESRREEEPVLIVRLHPYSRVPLAWRRWLDSMVADGTIELSDASLEEDIEAASLVVGMGSTLLQEAALMQRPVLVLSDPRYLKFIGEVGETCEAGALNWALVLRLVASSDEEVAANAQAARELMGIDNAPVRLCGPTPAGQG